MVPFHERRRVRNRTSLAGALLLVALLVGAVILLATAVEGITEVRGCVWERDTTVTSTCGQ